MLESCSAARYVSVLAASRYSLIGFSLHAGVVIAEHDRDALERLGRSGARPAFAQERLS
jgi:hypothetical protein